MALSDKNIIITPNIGQNSDPKIVFSGADVSSGPQNITLQVYPTSNGTISFEGSAGQLFSITNDLSGTIFSVNDISGIPSFEVLDTGLVKIAQYSGNILVGTGTDNGTDKLQVNGDVLATTIKAQIVTLEHSLVTTNTFTTSTTSQVSIDSFSSTTYRSAKYYVQMTSGSSYHVIELSLLHDGTTVNLVQYGEIKTGASLGTFDASISGGVLGLLFTATNAITTVKLTRMAIVL
jgi:hypothetical protein